MSTYFPNAEERAFLFQEAQTLESLLKELGSLNVVVEEVPSKREGRSPKYRVTFVVAPESMGMRVQATAADVYEAAIAAREETARQLSMIVNEAPRKRKASKIPFEFLH
jgi:hypothetical protein